MQNQVRNCENYDKLALSTAVSLSRLHHILCVADMSNAIVKRETNGGDGSSSSGSGSGSGSIGSLGGPLNPYMLAPIKEGKPSEKGGASSTEIFAPPSQPLHPR